MEDDATQESSESCCIADKDQIIDSLLIIPDMGLGEEVLTMKYHTQSTPSTFCSSRKCNHEFAANFSPFKTGNAS